MSQSKLYIIIIGITILAWFFFWLGKQTVKPIKTNNIELLKRKKELEEACQKKAKEWYSIHDRQIWQQQEIVAIKKEINEAKIIVQQAQKDAEHLQSENDILENNINHLQKQKQELENDIRIREIGAEAQANAVYQNKVIQMSSLFEQDRKKLENKFELLIQENEKIEKEIQNNQKELDSLKETRAAAITAAQQEKIIAENKDDYCLILPPQDQGDIEILKNVVKKISKPRSILMAIWQAYYQPVAKKKFPKILGKTTTVCGVYKITNQETGQCYIGQAVDVRRRWYDHCKCMLQIDAPQGNLLYEAAKEYGLDCFSFELLLECPSQELNRVEKYFIELYNSDAIGYNKIKGSN